MTKLTQSLSTCAAFFLLSFGAPPIANAWTFYDSGTIFQGTDTTSIFGNTSSNLSGRTYSELITLDPSLYELQYQGGGPDYIHSSNGTLSGTATDTITINGVSKTFVWDLSVVNTGATELRNPITQGIPLTELVQQAEQGSATDGNTLYTSVLLRSNTNAFNLSLSFNQVWSYIPKKGDESVGYFDYSSYGTNPSISFETRPNFYSINGTISPVPEPETYAMMLAGLALVGFTTLRRRQNFVI
jgi:hypothetical protein